MPQTRSASAAAGARGLLPWLAVAATLLAAVATAQEPADEQADHPAEARKLIEAAGGAAVHPGADALVVLDRTEVDVEDSGLAHIVARNITQALTAAGARDLGFLRFDYDPATQLIEVRRIRIHRADGGHEDVDPDRLADVTAPAHAIYWGARMKVLDLPDLAVGDAVETVTYRKGFQIAYLAGADEDGRYVPPMRGHYYDVVLFQGPHPIHEKVYELRTPRDKPVQYSVYNGEVFAAATFDGFTNTYRFWKREVPAAEPEWRSPGASDWVAKVVLATAADWPAKSRWFEEANRHQFEASDEIRAKVREIVAGLATDEERIAAINHWVAQEIRYCGLNMGKGEGYTLHPGTMIYEERSGVCKDIAGMAITMLRAAGYEVYPAMTMAGARVEAVPADQFNHCVVALRGPDGGFEMLDPTWIPFAMSNWSRAEGEQDFVIGTPEGEQLMRTPAYTPEDNRVDLTIRARIDADGTLRGRLRMIGAGYADTRLRRSVGSAPIRSVERDLRRWLATLAPGARLVSYELGDHRDFTRPLPLTVEFEVPGYALAGPRTLLWRPLGPQLVMANHAGAFRFAGRDLPAERETPALIWYPQRVVIEERVALPRGYRARAPERAWDAGDPGGIARLESAFDPDGDELASRVTVEVGRRTIEPEEWPGFRAVVGELEDAGDGFLVARREGD